MINVFKLKKSMKISQQKIYNTELKYTKLPTQPSKYSLKTSFCDTVSFGAIPVYNLKIKKLLPNGETESIPVKCSCLEEDSLEDKKTMKSVASWGLNSLGEKMAYVFFNPPQNRKGFFFTLEDKEATNGNKLYSCTKVADVKIGRHTMYVVDAIQASPAIAETKEYKGAGEVLLYAVVKKAKENGINSVMLYSKVDSFYAHIGFKSNGIEDIYSLTNDNYDAFLRRVEKKYGF